MPERRQLAAIMFTDIVGYTALMGSDEDKAFQVLRKNRELQQLLIKKYYGELLKEMGDGILAQFNSASDSVQCAIEIQMQAREELEGQIRIGIHLGDITFENKDVFGDGVNIASRLQSIADPGGIYISESVHNAIRSKNDIATQYLGEVKLKNVNYPFKTYYLKGEGLPVPSKNRINELSGSKITESIVVLPFDNYTGNNELEYFVAGMHSSLIGDIGKISAIRVISKTTSNAYKDTEKSIPEIASELGVNAVIEASVLSLGDSVCLQVKLFRAFPDEQQLWFHEYYEEKNQILNLYNTVTKQVSEEINIILTPSEEGLLSESRTVDPQAYDAYIRGQYHWDGLGKENLENAMKYFNMAIDIDPTWAPPYAGLAEVWIGRMQLGWAQPTIAIPKIYENMNKALELDPNSANSYYVKALMAVWTEWNWEKGEQEFLKAIKLSPNNALYRIYYAHLLICLNRSDEAIFQADLALELDPLKPLVMGLYGVVAIDVGEYQAAQLEAEKALSIDSDHFFANGALEYASYFNKDYDKSITAAKKLFPFKNEKFETIDKVYGEKGYYAALEVILSFLEDAAQKGYYRPCDIANHYLRVENKEKAIEWLEKGYEIHDPNMPYISTNFSNYDLLKDDPRYIDLLKKMNLPAD